MGLWDGGKVSKVQHLDGGIEEVFSALSALAGSSGVKKIAYASVVPAKDRRFKAFCRRSGFAFRQIGYGDFPLELDYPSPETIGADRLADAAAAVHLYGAPVLVMDFGTALTAAVVTPDGIWRGGVIAPGFPLMRDYLFERTAKLPRMELGGRCPKIGRSTEEAMRFGALVGYRGMVREIVCELQRNFAADFRLVATGGFAKWVLKDIGMPFAVDPSLTLHGAGFIASRVAGTKGAIA
jgi:type III pantothenate kinase